MSRVFLNLREWQLVTKINVSKQQINSLYTWSAKLNFNILLYFGRNSNFSQRLMTWYLIGGKEKREKTLGIRSFGLML